MGYEVFVAYGTKEKKSIADLEGFGFKGIPFFLERRISPLADIVSFVYLLKIFSSIKPDLVHLVTIKPYIYGGIAARITKVPSVVSAVSGLGSFFQREGTLSKIIHSFLFILVRIAFGHKNQRIVLQNTDDLNFLKIHSLCDLKKCELIRGVGVDLSKFRITPEPDGVPIVTFVGRLLYDKGLRELVCAARILNERQIAVHFYIAGEPDIGNPTSLSFGEFGLLKNNSLVNFLGHIEDIPALYERTNIACLPSYREGLPKSLIEAAASARAVVTTDTAGCRDSIIPGITGLLVPVKDAYALADAIEYLIFNPRRRYLMGIEGRIFAEKYFDVNKISQAHITIYKNLNINRSSKK